MAQRQTVAGFDIRFRTGFHGIINFKPHRRQNVALFPIGVMQQGNPRRAVRVVFNAGHFGRDTGFIPFKIDDPIMPFMAAAAMPDGDAPVCIAPAGFFKCFQQPFLRSGPGDLLKRSVSLKAPARRSRFNLFVYHNMLLTR